MIDKGTGLQSVLFCHDEPTGDADYQCQQNGHQDHHYQ